MITVRRAKVRHRDGNRRREVWLTYFQQDHASPLASCFGTLEVLAAGHLSPGGSVPRHPQYDTEIVTFVREGALAYEDSLGQSGIIQAGEFRRSTAGSGVRHRETNASKTDWAHVFQIWLRPAEADLEPGQEQKRFSSAERRGRLCVVASPDARRGSLRLHQHALIYSALLDPGTHLVHELSPGRSAWLHLVLGEATLEKVVLSTGDGAGFTAERAVSLTAREETEILLLDLYEPPSRVMRTRLDERRSSSISG